MEKEASTWEKLKDEIVPIVGFIAFGLAGIGAIIYSSFKEDSLKKEIFNQDKIVMTVLEERYENKLGKVPERHTSGLVSEAYSNETVKLDSSYTLKGRTDDGRTLAVSVIDGPDRNKEALDMLVDKGTRINFPRGNVNQDYRYIKGETYFTPETQFGNKRADRINFE